MRGKSSAGYTLIELLVVIAIIAIVAGLVFGAFGIAKKSGERARVVSDLKQIGTALHSHASDKNGLFPTAGGTIPYGQIDGETGLPSWQEQIDPYVDGDRKIFRGAMPEPVGGGQYRAKYFFGSRAAYRAGGEDAPAFQPLRAALIDRPSRYILAGEIRNHRFVDIDADCDNYTQDPAFGNGGVSETPVFLLFADGHAAAFDRFDPERMMVTYSEDPTE